MGGPFRQVVVEGEVDSQPQSRWRVRKEITLGNLIVLVLLTVTLIAGWNDYSYRIKTVEATMQRHEEIIQNQTAILNQLMQDRAVMMQVLEAFPPHKHDQSKLYELNVAPTLKKQAQLPAAVPQPKPR